MSTYTYVVLGAGRQGVAIAYDLARNGAAHRVTLADADEAAAATAVSRLQSLLPDTDCAFVATAVNVQAAATVRALLQDCDVCVSAVPYRFNLALTRHAIETRTHFCDLGGNTEIVRAQLALDAEARQARISVVPDCGLAPGLGNMLAAHGIARLDTPTHVHVRCGGLPEVPVGPLGYKLLFNIQGLINEYSGFGEYLRNGEPTAIPALTELETVELHVPASFCERLSASARQQLDSSEGRLTLEAAVTSGGTSTCAESFHGRVQTYDYKTLRYPGHFAIMQGLFALGCFEEHVTLANRDTLHPKPLFSALLESRLDFPEIRDIVILTVAIEGTHAGKPARLDYQLLDRHDEATGFTAMERTTAFPTALVAYLQASGAVSPGATALERAVPLEDAFTRLPQHDIHVSFEGSPG